MFIKDFFGYRRKAANENRDRWLNSMVQIAKPILTHFESGNIKALLSSETKEIDMQTYATACFTFYGLAAWLEARPTKREEETHANFTKFVINMLETMSCETHVNYCLPNNNKKKKGELMLLATASLVAALSLANQNIANKIDVVAKQKIIALVNSYEDITPENEVDDLYIALILQDKKRITENVKNNIIHLEKENPWLTMLVAQQIDGINAGMREMALTEAKSVDINGAIIDDGENIRLSFLTTLAYAAYKKEKLNELSPKLMQKILFSAVRRSIQVGAFTKERLLSSVSFSLPEPHRQDSILAYRYQDMGVFIVMGLPLNDTFWQNTGDIPNWITPDKGKGKLH